MKIDLSNLPEGTKWIAIDEDGDASAHSDEPSGTSYAYDLGRHTFLGWLGNVHD